MRPLALLSILVLLIPAGHAATMLSGEELTVTNATSGNLYGAAALLDVLGPVSGDALVTGGNVSVAGRVEGDVAAAGGQVFLSGQIEGDVRAAGGTVEVRGPVSGDAALAGGSVQIYAPIGGDAILTGGEILIGKVAGNAYASGGSILINGTIEGDAHLFADTIEFGPEGRILGNLNYTAERRVDESKVAGSVTYVSKPSKGIAEHVAAALFSLGAALLVGMLLIWLIPGRFASAADGIIERPWRTLLAGLAALILVPLLCVLLLITLIGIPLAMVIAAAYVGILYFGKLVLAFAVGRRIFGQSAYLALLAGLALYYLLKLIPLIGGAVTLAGALFGLGAIVLALWPKGKLLPKKKRRR